MTYIAAGVAAGTLRRKQAGQECCRRRGVRRHFAIISHELLCLFDTFSRQLPRISRHAFI